MAWTSPPTFTDGSVLTASQLNLLRDNLLETAPAKATASGRLIVTTGLNGVAERAVESAAIAATHTTTSTSYVDLAAAGPTVTVTTGSAAILLWSALMSNSTANAKTFVDYTVSGASTRSAADGSALRFQSDSANQEMRAGSVMLESALTPGSNVFKLVYKTNGGTGSFSDRRLTVIAL